MKKILSGLVALSLTTVVGNSAATYNNLISAQTFMEDTTSMNWSWVGILLLKWC